jgi:hypothetical protein
MLKWFEVFARCFFRRNVWPPRSLRYPIERRPVYGTLVLKDGDMRRRNRLKG